MKKMNHLNLTLNHSRNEKQEKETKNFQNAHSDPPPPTGISKDIYTSVYIFFYIFTSPPPQSMYESHSFPQW